jgi:hypothetical protein
MKPEDRAYQALRAYCMTATETTALEAQEFVAGAIRAAIADETERTCRAIETEARVHECGEKAAMTDLDAKEWCTRAAMLRDLARRVRAAAVAGPPPAFNEALTPTPPPDAGERCGEAIIVDASLTACRRPKGHAGRHRDYEDQPSPPPPDAGPGVFDAIEVTQGSDARRQAEEDARALVESLKTGASDKEMQRRVEVAKRRLATVERQPSPPPPAGGERTTIMVGGYCQPHEFNTVREVELEPPPAPQGDDVDVFGWLRARVERVRHSYDDTIGWDAATRCGSGLTIGEATLLLDEIAALRANGGPR